MAEKGQTEENCNLRNTNKIDNEVGEKKERKKGEIVILATLMSTLKISRTP